MSLRSHTHRAAAEAALAAALVLALAAPVAAGNTRSVPTFTSSVDVVNLNVSVTDTRDRHVAGLGARDFTVYEDGVPQELVLFTQERLPISLAVLIDSSLSMHNSLPAVKTAALRLLRTLRADDQAEVVQFNHKFTVAQDFTSDMSLLHNAVQGIRPEGATGVYNALYLTLKDPRFRRSGTDLTRQAVVVLSDGEDTSSLVSDDQVVELARKGNVTVFAISLTPVRTAALDRNAADRAAYFLTAVARETGGRSYFPPNLDQLDGVYDRIAEDLRTQYALGYVSNNPARDGRWRKIAIATAQGNLLLRHKLGYYAGALRRVFSRRPEATSTASSTVAPQPQ